MQGAAFERQEAAPVPHIGSLLTHTPRGGSPGPSRGERSGLPVEWRRQEGQIELSPVPGAQGGRCAGTQPGGNYSSGNYSGGIVRSDDATLQEWQGWLASSWGSREPPGCDWAHSAVPCVRFSQPLWGVPNLPGCAPQDGAALDVSPPGCGQGTSALH